MARAWTAAALAAFAVQAAPAAAEPVPCRVLEARLAPDAQPAGTIALQFAAGRVAGILIRTEAGEGSRTLLEPSRPGLSRRSLLRPWPQDPSRWMAGDSQVTAEPAGTVLAETRVTPGTRPEAPLLSRMRLACTPKG